MSFLCGLKLVSLLLAMISITMLFPALTALFLGEAIAMTSFFYTLFGCLFICLIIQLLLKKIKIHLSIKAAFIVVASCWIFASILGAMPLFLGKYTQNFIDAFFESVSGFTTTGATIFKDVESLPRSINLWRCQMHWLGGMGIVALTVALMPLIGVGGFQLIKAETTGPEKGKISPKITVTAKILWFIYMGLTILQTILLMVFGKMNFLDAISHSFSTLGTGGFSTKNTSVGYYNSSVIDWIIIIFMFLAGINFNLFYYVFSKRIKEIFENTELKVYISIILISVLIIIIGNKDVKSNFVESLRFSFFHVVSFITTTGFSTDNYENWTHVAQTILFLLMFVGGMSGSTGGGIKVVRWVVLGKQMNNEVKKMLHPHGVFSIQLNGRPCRKEIVFNVSAFIFLYAILLLLTTIVASFDGKDILTALSVSLTTVGNIGLGFAGIGPSGGFFDSSSFSKLWYSFSMLSGRLELYTILLIFMPEFWKK